MIKDEVNGFTRGMVLIILVGVMAGQGGRQVLQLGLLVVILGWDGPREFLLVLILLESATVVVVLL